MLEIKGRVTTAICYAKVIEDEAIEQIRRMCDYDLTRGSKVRIMPDVHAGKGCTIGTTMTITDKICPNIVGVDIGCGMYTVKLQDQAIDFEKIDEACHYIPSGMNVWEGRMERFDLTQLKCYRSLKDAKRLEGIYFTSVNVDTLDEAPMAYKSLADIIDVIRDSVEIIDIMKPVYNFKASDKKFHAL